MADMPGFCKTATLEDVRGHGYVLTPGRYVAAADSEDDEMPFAERFSELRAKLEGQLGEAERLTTAIRVRLRDVEVNV